MKQSNIFSTLTGALIPLLKKWSIFNYPFSTFNFQLSIVFALALFAIAPQAAQGQTITFNPNLNNNGYTVIEGHNITLTVNAGPGVTYQWYIENKSGDIEVVNGGGYSGGGGGGGVRGY